MNLVTHTVEPASNNLEATVGCVLTGYEFDTAPGEDVLVLREEDGIELGLIAPATLALTRDDRRAAILRQVVEFETHAAMLRQVAHLAWSDTEYADFLAAEKDTPHGADPCDGCGERHTHIYSHRPDRLEVRVRDDLRAA